MGDRTSMQVTIYDCPPDQVNAVLTALENHSLGETWGSWDTPGYKELKLGASYVADEVSCGSSDEIASELETYAPDASFEVWEDPKYEWLGSLNLYTPTLGHYGAECDSDGQAQFTAEQIVGWIENGLDLEKIKRRLGMPWRLALAEMATANVNVVLPRIDEDKEES